MTTDHLGSPRVTTDQLGAVTARKDYSAFGEETVTTERQSALGYSGADELRKGYTGYEKDNESGLDFAQARYYNSTHGRYTSVDPLTASASIRNPQTFNRYSYVLNSPYKFTDPLGLLPAGVGTASWGYCGAQYGSCEGDYHWGVGSVYVEPPPEPHQENTDEGAAENTTTDAHDGPDQQASEPAATPPAPNAEQNEDSSLDNQSDADAFLFSREDSRNTGRVSVFGAGSDFDDGCNDHGFGPDLSLNEALQVYPEIFFEHCLVRDLFGFHFGHGG